MGTTTTDRIPQEMRAMPCGGAKPVHRGAAGRSRPECGTLGTPARRAPTVRALLPPLTIFLLVVTTAALLLIAVALFPPPLTPAVASPPRGATDASLASSIAGGATWGRRAADVTTLAQSAPVALPADPAVVAMARLIYAPAAADDAHTFPGPLLLVVEAGSLTVEFAAPAARQSVDPATPLTADSRVLGAGDRLVVPIDATAALRNAGSEPVVALAAGVFPAALLSRPAMGGESPHDNAAPAWVTDGSPGVTVHPLVSGWLVDPMAGAATLTLQRLSLPAGAQAPLAATDAAAVTIETGVGALASGQGLTWQQRADGSNAGLTRGETATLLPGESALLQDGANGTLRNAGSSPLQLLVLTVVPTSAIGPSPNEMPS